MSNKGLFNIERYNKENQNTFLDNKDNNNNIIGVIKERKCIQILKDRMKKIAKRLNSKDDKKVYHKNKSNDCVPLIKKISNKNNLK